MQGLTESQLLLGLVALAVILLFARSAGYLAKTFGQPEVVGEFFAGFLLGPSVFGSLVPGVYHALFTSPGVSFALSGFSWVGAILLLLVAGMEADLNILRSEARPGALAAGFAIVSSLAAGMLFAWLALGRPFRLAFFLGIVLSVTAVSVAAKILIEREVLRRRYAQVILAAGIASEVLVWVFVSIVGAAQSSSPILVAVRSTGFAVGFFIFMFVVGGRFIAWAMRGVADVTRIAKGQLSLVLMLAFLSAALTQALGLHPLLGAFVFGVLLRRAPRANRTLIEGVQSLTSGLFAPIFFVLAGMRVNVLQLGSGWAVGMVALMLVVATLVKVGFGTLGARLGGLPRWEAALVGVGLNLKGGTDIIVAIVGVESGLLADRTYTMYAVVAILTVIFSPPLMTRLERLAPPGSDEVERLEHEEATRRAYVPGLERALVPVLPQLKPALAVDVVQRIAISKHDQGQIFDITHLQVNGASKREEAQAEVQAESTLSTLGTLRTVDVTRRRVDVPHALKTIVDASREYDLVAVGAAPPEGASNFTFGRLQDALVRRTQGDLLVVVARGEGTLPSTGVRRILVPINGMEYSMAAGDIAAHLAVAYDAELVIQHVARPEMDGLFWHERDHRLLRRQAAAVVGELAFRVRRLGVRAVECPEVADGPAQAILRELDQGDYQLLVMGALDHGGEGSPRLGGVIRTVLGQSAVPAVLLIAHESAPDGNAP